MNFKGFLEKGLIEEHTPNFKQILRLQDRALKDLKTAETILETDTEWAYTIAYMAMMRIGRAFILAEGYRPKGRDQQRAIIQILKEVLGEGHKRLAIKFDRIRRKGQAFIEDSEKPISKYEVEEAIKDAKEFIQKVMELARDRNPQLSLL